MTATTNLIRSSCAVASNKKVELISRSAQPFFVRWIQIQKPLQSSPKKLSFSGAMKTVRFFTIPFVAAFALLQPAKAVAAEAGKYLFILSGQSNMRGHRPDEAFTPAGKAAFEPQVVIVYANPAQVMRLVTRFSDSRIGSMRMNHSSTSLNTSSVPHRQQNG